MARIKRTARSIGDFVLAQLAPGSCAQDALTVGCGEQPRVSDPPARATRAKKRFAVWGGAERVIVPTRDFGPPDARIVINCEEDEDENIVNLGEEPAVDVTGVDLGEVGSCAVASLSIDSKNPRGQSKPKKVSDSRTFAINLPTMTKRDANILAEQKYITQY